MTKAETAHNELPLGWKWAQIGEILQPSADRIDPSKASGITYIGLEHIEKNTGRILGQGYSDDVKSLKSRFSEGDLLYGKLRPYLNKVWVAEFDGLCSTDILVFRDNKFILNKYLKYRFLQEDFVKYANQNASGVQHPRVDFKKLANFKITIAPLPEQHRIVARIEELFSRLDAGVEALRRARTQLQRYRQSVLQAAVEGRLTAEWREAHPEVEPAEKLLEQILKRKKKIESFRLNAESPFDIPRDWAWTELGLILSKIEAGKNFRCVERSPSLSEVGVVKVSAVSWGEFDETQSKTCNDPSRINANYFIKENDFLFSRANTIDLVGACVIVENVNHQLMLSDKILRFSFIEVPSQWILYVLRSRHGRNEIESLATGNQESMRNIGQDRIKRIKVPIPPKSEISEIIKAIRYFLSIASTIEKSIECNLKIGIQLRQSILQRAFQGRLVPQDPSDEPASLLLERIRAERINEAPRRGRKSKAQQARLLQ